MVEPKMSGDDALRRARLARDEVASGRSVFGDDDDADDDELDDDYDDEIDDEFDEEDEDDELDDDEIDDEYDEEDEDDEEEDDDFDFDDEFDDDEFEDDDDDEDAEVPVVSKPAASAVAPLPGGELPHWADPPTSQTPAVGDDHWSSLTGSQPRWRSDITGYEEEEQSDLGEGVKLAESPEEFFEFEDHLDGSDELEDLADDDDFDVEDFDFDGLDFDGLDDDNVVVPIGPAAGAAAAAGVAAAGSAATGAKKAAAGKQPAKKASSKRPAAKAEPAKRPGSDMASRVITGIVLAALAIAAFSFGQVTTLVLVSAALLLCTSELSTVLRQAGYQPATLLTLVASVGAPVAAYHRGLDGVLIIVVITTVFSLLWFVVKAGDESPVLNASVTTMSVCYVGVLGSFAALMLRDFGQHGIGMILAAVIGTIGHDVGALMIGRSAGRTQLTDISPKKTREGLIGGMFVAVIAVVVVVGMFKLAPFGEVPDDGAGFGLLYAGVWQAVWLGVVIAIAAPLGDLAESLIKRDLGVKDMSSLLRGHGGALDRFDAMLFTLPATYYLARLVLM